MKPGEAFKVDAAWWKKNKPITLKPTGLGKALTAFATSKAAYLGARDNDKKFEAALTALDAVEAARQKAITRCGNDHVNTKAALQRDDALDKARQEIMTAYSSRFVSPLRQIKNRLADLKRWNASLDGKIKTFQAEKATYDAKKLKALEKDFTLISSKYLPDAITGASSAAEEFRKHATVLQARFPNTWAEYAVIRDDVADEVGAAKKLKIRVQKHFPAIDI